MATKRMEWQVGFTADTSQLKKQLNDVKLQLRDISSLKFADKSFPLTEQMEKASLAAGDLLQKLNQATNANTGNLDLTKFRKSLEDSGKSLAQYQQELGQLGEVGQKAFLSVASSVANAEAPVYRLSNLTEKMFITLKNTLRWQVSTAALNAFIGSIQTAYGYAKDLNESLNNIRIVSGKSVEQMAKFAEDANKAAGRLSSTTLDYTNAALIFFQQGLSEDEVKRRTDVTLQLAEVTGDSVETVSSQLTAIWNNFSDGSDDLARYADVLTRLGAVTASSSDEIAQGMQKFSAVANTVGLSYDYAAAALATLTATTRESADVVGTSLRTIFARLESLQLGDTLEDGVTLTKYSEALRTAGVEVLDVNGKIKDMNTILDETMQAWAGLDKTQQTALATTVAGVRQYAQFIALMENQDFFRQNIKEAEQATGTLKGQASVYAESWEAARDRVKNAAQDLYGALINEDFFIDLDNFTAGFLHTIADMVEGLGGMRGVLLSLGGILTKLFQKQLAEGLRNAAFNLSLFTKQTQKANAAFQAQSANLIANSTWASAENKGYATEIGLNQRIAEISQNITNQQKEQLQNLAHLVGMETRLVAETEQELKQRKAAAEATQKQLFKGGKGNAMSTKRINFGSADENIDTYSFLSGSLYAATPLNKQGGWNKTTTTITQSFAKLSQQIGAMENASTKLKAALGDDFQMTGNLTQSQAAMFEQVSTELAELNINFDRTGGNYVELEGHINNAKAAQDAMYAELIRLMDKEGISAEEAVAALDKIQAEMEQAGALSNTKVASTNALTGISDEFNTQIGVAQKKTSDWATQTVGAANALFNLGQVISTTTNLMEQFNDGTATVAGTLTALGSISMSIVQLIPLLKTVTGGVKSLYAVLSATALGTGGAGIVLAAIGVIIAGIAAAITYAVKQSHKAEEQLKQAQEAAAKAKEEFQTTKQTYDNLIEGNDQYNSLVQQLDALTAGSKAFEEQLVKVNDEAQKLIELLPELKKYSYFDENGVLRFTPQAQDVIDIQSAKTVMQGYGVGALDLQAQRMALIDPAQSALDRLSEYNPIFGHYNEQTRRMEQTEQEKDFARRLNALKEEGDFFSEEWDNLAADMEAAGKNPGFKTLVQSTRQTIKEYEASRDSLLEDSAYNLRSLASQQDLSDLSAAGRVYAQNSVQGSLDTSDLDVLGMYSSVANSEDKNEKRSYNNIQGKKISKLDANLQGILEQYAADNGITFDNSQTVKEFLAAAGFDEFTSDTWLTLLAQIWNKKVEDFRDTLLNNGQQFEEVVDSIPGATDNIKEIIAKVITGQQSDTSGLSIDEIQFLQDYAQEILDSLAFILAKDGTGVAGNYLEGFLTETAKVSLDDAKNNIKNEVKAFVGGLGSLFDQLQEGIDVADLEEENLATYNKLKDKYGEYLDKMEQMDEDSYERREYIRDLFNLAFADGVKELAENGASNLEILQTAFDNLDRQIEDSLDTLDDYFGLMSLVPQDLIVSFSDLRTLIQEGHSALLENAKITAEGQIQLDTDVAKNYVTHVKDKYVADLQQRKQTLEYQRDLLQQELDNYKELSDADKLRYLAGAKNNKNLGLTFEDLGKIGSGAMEDIQEAARGSALQMTDLIEAAQGLYQTFQGNYFDYGNLKKRLEADAPYKRKTKFSFVPSDAVDELNRLSDEEQQAFKDIDTQFQTLMEQDIKDITALIDFTDQAINNTEFWDNLVENLGTSTEDAAKAQDKLLDALKDTVARYHEINRALQNLEREYSRLEKATDRAYGKEHLDGLAQEEESLKNQIELQKKKLLVVQANLALDLKRVKELVPYGEIGDDGEILNYTQILADAAKEYNDAIKDTNGMSEEDKAKYEETMDAIKQRYEDIKDALDQYEETLDEMHDLEDKIIENKYLFEDKRLESLNYKLELVLDVKENEDAINEFGKKLAESFGDYLTHGQKSLDFSAQLSAANQALLPHLQTQWNELLDMYNNANDATSRADIEKELESVRDQIYSTLEALLDYVDVLENALPEAVDAARERFDAMIDQISHTKTIYDAIKQLTELQGLTVHTAEGYARLMDIAQQSLEAEILNARMQREWYENAYSRLMEAEAALEQVQEGDDAYDLLKNARDALLEEYNAAQEAMMESAITAIEEAREMFKTQIDKAKEDFSKALTNGLGIEYMQDRYDRYIDSEERYLDVVNEEYEVTKWYRKLQEQIDKAKSTGAIERLKELQKEIDVRRANNTLSQYDLDILNAKYEMTLKQIALEEAQSSATNMRLQRDSQGNWNYVYTADYDSIEQAQTEFEDAANNYYNIAKQQVKDVTQEILDTWQECADKIAEIYMDETLTVEEREERIAELRAYYAEKVKALEEEKNVAVQDIYDAAAQIAEYYEQLYSNSLNNMGDNTDRFVDRYGQAADNMGNSADNMGNSSENLADRFGTSLENMTGSSNTFAGAFGQDVLAMLQDMDQFLSGFTGDLGDMTSSTSDFERYFDQYLQQASQAAWEYQNNVDRVTRETGTTLDELQNHMSQVKDTITRLNQNMSDSYNKFGQAGVNAIQSIWNKIPSIDQVTTSFQRQTQEIYNTIRAYEQWLSEQSRQVWNPNTLYQVPQASEGNTGEGDVVIIQRPTEGKENRDDEENVLDYWPHYAHGGYTGPGHEAQPAVLHGSEYVLNEDDTTKILSAAAFLKNLNLDVLLSIMETIKDKTLIGRNRLGDVYTTPGFRTPPPPIMQQSVTIHADFPNATKSDEIEQAFDNLINRAIQYTELKQ